MLYAKFTLARLRADKYTLAFEYSDVRAEIKGAIDSVKNPSSGLIRAASIGELILDGATDASKTEIITELRA